MGFSTALLVVQFRSNEFESFCCIDWTVLHAQCHDVLFPKKNKIISAAMCSIALTFLRQKDIPVILPIVLFQSMPVKERLPLLTYAVAD